MDRLKELCVGSDIKDPVSGLGQPLRNSLRDTTRIHPVPLLPGRPLDFHLVSLLTGSQPRHQRQHPRSRPARYAGRGSVASGCHHTFQGPLEGGGSPLYFCDDRHQMSSLDFLAQHLEALGQTLKLSSSNALWLAKCNMLYIWSRTEHRKIRQCHAEQTQHSISNRLHLGGFVFMTLTDQASSPAGGKAGAGANAAAGGPPGFWAYTTVLQQPSANNEILTYKD